MGSTFSMNNCMHENSGPPKMCIEIPQKTYTRAPVVLVNNQIWLLIFLTKILKLYICMQTKIHTQEN